MNTLTKILTVAFFGGVAFGQIAPSPLEAFASLPNASVSEERVPGLFESAASVARVSRIAVKHGAQVRRGVRILLSHGGAAPACDGPYEAWQTWCKRAPLAMYFDSEELARIGSLNRAEAPVVSSYSGAPGGFGVIVAGYVFPRRTAAEFMALLTDIQ